MFYKLRNTASLDQIEQEFNKPFVYPKLYKPAKVINGLVESSLPIISIEQPEVIEFSIWGLLPVNFEDNWEIFQNISNTLNINISGVNEDDPFVAEALNKRRCLVVVTGFFTTYIQNGKLQSFHVYKPNKKPFCVAGVYNELSDGFKTCSILIKPITKENKNFIPSFSKTKPLIIKKKCFDYWLDKNNSFSDLKTIIQDSDFYNFQSEPIDQQVLGNQYLSNNKV
ncbi:SOS response-associated peptidase family protein [Lacinutrix salivirga]